MGCPDPTPKRKSLFSQKSSVMKKIVSTAACILAAVSFLVSCQPKETPDGKCEITAFSLPASLNSALSADVNGTIDASAKTITLVLPASVTSRTFVPTFTASEYDVVKIAGATITSGETSATIADGTKISVSDDISVLTAEYTIAIKENDEAAALTAISFKAADNSLLSEDVAPDAIEPQMLVRVPAAAFRQELTLTVAAGENDAIKVNNTSVESGSSIKVDTSFPVDITVTDEVAGKTAQYVLKVGKILEYVVTKLCSYTDGSLSDYSIVLNPNDNLPYIAYTRKIGDEKYNNISVAKWNGSTFGILGTGGFADASARSASKPRIAFAPDGTIYAGYLGGEVASKPTIKKFDSDWTLFGTAGATEHNNNSSYDYPLFVHPANSKVSFYWRGNTKKVDTYRTMNFTQFNGTEWVSNIVSGTVPAYAADGSGMYYTSSLVQLGDKLYMASAFNQYGYYIQEVGGDGTLTTIVENYKPSESPHGLPANLKLITDGSALYLVAVDRASAAVFVYTVDIAGKTLKALGSGIPVTISSNGGVSEEVAADISPVDGLIVSIYETASGIPVFAYMNADTGYQWQKFAVEGAPESKGALSVVFDKDGKGYITYQSAEAIEVFSVGLEADIIPE